MSGYLEISGIAGRSVSSPLAARSSAVVDSHGRGGVSAVARSSLTDDAAAAAGAAKHFLPPRGPSTGPPRPTHLQRRSLQYIFCAGTLAILVCTIGFYDFNLIGNEHYDELKSNLRPAWFPFSWLGSKGVDVADSQWYYFVIALPPTLPILVLFLVLSRKAKQQSAPVVMRYSPTGPGLIDGEGGAEEVVVVSGELSPGGSGEGLQKAAAADEGSFVVNRNLYFGRELANVYAVHVVFGVIIALCITGTGFLFGLVLMLVNYYGIAMLQRHVSFRVCMAVMWITHIATLFINYRADGYRFAWFGLSFLDGVFTPLIRWNVHFNMTVLRMIAFNSDYWEACMSTEEKRERVWSKHDRCCVQCAVIRDENHHISPLGGQAESLRCYKCRTEISRPQEEYNVLSYLAYMFYPPLFIAGPMSSFNAYVSHLHHPTRAVTGKPLFRYGLRFLFNALVLSTMMHYVWITAILYTPQLTDEQVGLTGNTTSVNAAATPRHSVFQTLGYVSKAKLLYLMLAFLWCKFNVFWKFFRLFALLDGADPPEDMRRCFSNTVNIQGFWRDWHASFNLWIVRYMYIPMGGRHRIKYSIFPIFFFIAIWHDIEMRLLFWALLMCVFMVPEVTITAFFASKKNPFVLRVKRNIPLYRFLRVCAACFNMLLLIIVNLIGFSIGMSGATEGIREMVANMSGAFVVSIAFVFLCAANVAIQSRDEEAYQEQVLKLKYDLQSR